MYTDAHMHKRVYELRLREALRKAEQVRLIREAEHGRRSCKERPLMSRLLATLTRRRPRATASYPIRQSCAVGRSRKPCCPTA